MPPAVLREALPKWVESYPTRSAKNEGYATHGILAPLDVFAARATQVFTIKPGTQDAPLD